jgi:UDP-N-acetyl-D-glucosamine dehydrogenase
MNGLANLSKKISSKTAKVGVIGMGYVGAALADIVIKQGFPSTGFVRNPDRAARINKQNKKHLSATTEIALLENQDVILICVQTPVDENKLPDLTALRAASEQVRQHLRKDQLIIVESSIATGTTRNVVLPILDQNKKGLKAGEDYFLSFSPERVDPGNKQFDLNQIPKVVSGLGEADKTLSVLFYEQIMDRVVPVSTLETAELVKLFENTFRLINISLVNELATYAKSWGIDMFEVVNAASSKPFGFMPHYPSPGIGGHCIPVDPFYMLDDAKKRGITLRMIEEAGKINDMQPVKVVNRTVEILQNSLLTSKTLEAYRSNDTQSTFVPQVAVALAGVKGGEKSKTSDELITETQNKKVLLIGLAYKPDIDDLRESSSLKIWKLLEKQGYDVSYHDPYIPQINGLTSKDLTSETIKSHDIIIIATNHSNIDYAELASYNKPILDTRHVYAADKPSHVYYL